MSSFGGANADVSIGSTAGVYDNNPPYNNPSHAYTRSRIGGAGSFIDINLVQYTYGAEVVAWFEGLLSNNNTSLFVGSQHAMVVHSLC